MFNGVRIIGHKLYLKNDYMFGILEKMQTNGFTDPNLTFTGKLYFEEDNILIYYTPGHTEDCISVLDMNDKILFVGDNLERSIP